MTARAATYLGWAATVATAVAVTYAVPAVAALGPARRWTPVLAGAGDPRHVALTFDDGPHPASTPQFLRLLDAYHVRATFFLLGEQVQRSPGLAAEIVAAGHEIGLHGHTHRCLLARGPAGTLRDLRRARDVISAATGVRPTWYRPPYGVLTTGALSSARRLRLRPVLWTNWGRDWTATATPQSVLRTVTQDLRGGATILLHDSDITSAVGSWRSSLGALPRLIDSVRQRGLTIGPLAEHGIPV
jgi:peptidoglycan/xylan/chitin deacetylase (PgdA/CDA1 family)